MAAIADQTNTVDVKHGANFVSSLAKGLEILSAFSQGELLGNQQLVARTGFPKATVSRLTSTLIELGYLRLDEQSRKFSMGTRVLGMGASVQRNIGLQRIARPFMEALSEESNATVGMGTRDRLGIVFLEVIRPSRNRLTVNTDVGSVLPLESTAIGLTYLVAALLAERTRLLERLRRRHADNWEAVRGNIEKAHAEYQRTGFVSSQKSWDREVNGVGVPLFLNERRGLFVFNCAGPSHQLPLQYLKSVLGPRLIETVASIRQAMLDNPQVPLNPLKVHTP
ncbi:IclR family transcriptional regulator (plasmid) [Polaromonas sp. P1-6]|nr:IclR family transcriptional regulator [Polaromonas sp. P1-6]